MGFDLKRTYFSLASFVVLMVAFVAGLGLIGALASVVVLSPVPFAERYPPGSPDRPAEPPQSSVSGGAQAAQSGTAAAVPVQGGVEKPFLVEDWELRGARGQLATSLAAVIVALPIWAFHWRRFRRLAADGSAYLLHRVYGYAVMVVTLVTMIVSGADVLRQPLLAMLGALDLSTRYAQLSLTRGVLGSVLGLAWATLVWWYHWRVVETAPSG